MRVTFLLPFTTLAGSTLAMCELANQLTGFGHEVSVAYLDTRESAIAAWRAAGVRRLGRYLKREALLRRGRKEPFWFKLKAHSVAIPDWSEANLPDGEFVIATDWTTAEVLPSLSARNGLPVFLIQGYDIFNADPARVDATWRLPVAEIAVSSFIQSLAEERFGQKTLGPLVLGVDRRVFFPAPTIVARQQKRRMHSACRIGMLYHPMPNKGVGDGLRAFELARREFPEIQLVMYGGDRPNPPLPSWVEYHRYLRGEKLRRIYCSCDIWLTSSWQEGCHMPPMEAMACQCAVVTTDVGGIRDYATPGETALVSPPRQPEALARNLVSLLENPEQLETIALAGYQKIREFTWEHSAARLESYLLEIAANHATHQAGTLPTV